MALTPVDNPFGVFLGLDGRPLNGGKVYIGLPNEDPETDPQQVWWTDDGSGPPAFQPLQTISGYVANSGAPARFWTGGAYSIRVRDRQNNEVFYAPNVEFELPDGTVTADSLTDDPGEIAAITDKLTYLAYGAGAEERSVRDKLYGISLEVEDFGGVFDGATDDTDAWNAAILAGYKSAANVASPAGETYAITVNGKRGADSKISGTILLPSQVRLDLNGGRLIGNSGTAGNDAYDPSGQALIETAYYNGAALVSNKDAANQTTWRVVGSAIENGSLINANCALNLFNFQEGCFTRGLRYSNVSAAKRLKNCFYSRHLDYMIRNSAKATGQPGILLHGAAAHAMVFEQAFHVGCSVGIKVTATNSFGVTFKGSFEEGYADNSVGMLFDGSYCQGWSIAGAYWEGVRIGIQAINSAAHYGSTINGNYFSGCEYAVKAIANAFRLCQFLGNSTPDEGVGIRNLVDFSASGNDVFVQFPSQVGYAGGPGNDVPSNYLLGKEGTIVGRRFWRDTVDATRNLARDLASSGNKDGLGDYNWMGRELISVANNPPFLELAYTTTTCVIDTEIIYDPNAHYAYAFVIADNDGTYSLSGFLCQGTFQQITSVGGKGLNQSTNSGRLRITVTGLNFPGSTGVFTGKVRHA